MSEKQTKLLEFEERMEGIKLSHWTESDIRSWLTLRERANEDRRREMDYSRPAEKRMENEWLGATL